MRGHIAREVRGDVGRRDTREPTVRVVFFSDYHIAHEPVGHHHLSYGLLHKKNVTFSKKTRKCRRLENCCDVLLLSRVFCMPFRRRIYIVSSKLAPLAPGCEAIASDLCANFYLVRYAFYLTHPTSFSSLLQREREIDKEKERERETKRGRK